MTVKYLMYKYLKKVISDNTDIKTITFDDRDAKKENCIAVKISDFVLSNRKIKDGSYTHKLADVILYLQTFKDKEGKLKNISELENVGDILTLVHNKNILFKNGEVTIENDYDSVITIGQINLTTGAIRVKINEFEIPEYSLHLQIHYTYKNN